MTNIFNLSFLDDPSLAPAFAAWLQNTGIPVLVVIIITTTLNHFGKKFVAGVIRKTVRSTPFSSVSRSEIKKRQDTVISLFDAMLKVIVVVVAGIIIVEMLFPKVNLTPLFASAGVLGIVLGFGAQSLIKDFLIGMFIIFENQYNVGDVVKIDDAEGTVMRINVRSTIIKDKKDNVHYILNSSITHVVNITTLHQSNIPKPSKGSDGVKT
jgi:small-conductance mechanosensitive channel